MDASLHSCPPGWGGVATSRSAQPSSPGLPTSTSGRQGWKGQGSACFTQGTSLSLRGHRARGFLTGHGRVTRGSAACLSRFLDTSLATPGQGRRAPVTAGLPRRVCRGLELMRLQQALCVCPAATSIPLLALAPCPPRVALPDILPLPPSAALSGTHFCLSPSVALLGVSCPGQWVRTTPGDALPQMFSVGLFLTLSVLDCLLAPPSFLLGLCWVCLRLFSSLWDVSLHVCVPVCVRCSPPYLCARTRYLPLAGAGFLPVPEGTAWLPVGRPAGGQPGARAPSTHPLGSLGAVRAEKVLCPCL